MLSINTENIARELDRVPGMSTERLMTGWFSGMDEYVLKLLEAYPQLRKTHQAFSAARSQLGPNRPSDKVWTEMQRAAKELAVALRKLGNIDILLCERSTRWGTCRHGILSDGTCAMNWHTD